MYIRGIKIKTMSGSKDTVKFVVLEGEAYYAFLHQPDRGNEEHNIGPSYKLELVPTPESLKIAEELGLNIKKAAGKIPGDHISIRSKVDPVKYPDRAPPKVFDSKRNTIPKEILVGNGSKVRVRLLPLEYGKGKIMPILKEVQVIELIKYVPTPEEIARKGTFLGEVKDGFTVDSNI